MLEKLNMDRALDKETYREKKGQLGEELAVLQRTCRELGIPVMIVFEGLGASGKGTQINELIGTLDPRGFQVYAINGESEEEQLRPFLWRFWTKIPARGRIAIFDRSWYRKVLIDRFDKVTSKEELGYAYDEINSFERQLTDDGMVVIKFYLYITKEEQKKRFQKLLDNRETAWRVSKGDLRRNEEYKRFVRMNEEMLERTDTDYAPWTVVEANDKRYAAVKIMGKAVEVLREAVERKKAEERQMDAGLAAGYVPSCLSNVDLSLSLDKEEYKEQLNSLQRELSMLHSELYRRRVPVILAFEGWDAAGKGGAIKRLTSCLDPRGYAVHPTASPNDIEKAHHYLWRFWRDVPKGGHIAIFDRTWYGRVMVERLEGFCTEQEWRRAYREINDMEANFVNYGAIVLKFWMQIDKDEQERRFWARMEDPAKQWKITEEDWRNREKWDQYVQAVDEMLLHTSTTYAPWIIVEANSKYYARIKVLRTVVDALKKRL